MRKTALALTLITLSAAVPVYADGLEPMVSADNRFKILNYDESEVYTITTRYGYQTNIVFGNKEEIQTISVGDRSLWQIIPSGNRLFIRPMEENVITNMTILTNKRSYQFDLKSQAAGKTEGTIYVAKFRYPDDTAKPGPASASIQLAPGTIVEPPPAEHAASAPVPASSPFAPASATYTSPVEKPAYHMSEPSAEEGKINYSYTYSGPDAIAPLQVYDDGQSTYIKYADLTPPLPNTYTIDADGRETAVPYKVHDGMMVVQAVAGELALKSSAGTVKVYNEILNPQQ